MSYYKSMTPEQKARKREKSKAWAAANPAKVAAMKEASKYRVKAFGIQNNVKKDYPAILAESSLDVQKVQEWLETVWDSSCPYCGGKATSPDHIIPLSRGGKHELHNLEMICLRCNHAKRDLTKTEFLEWIAAVSKYTKAARELS